MIKTVLKASLGADFTLFSLTKNGLPEPQLRDYMENYKLMHPENIKDYTFVG